MIKGPYIFVYKDESSQAPKYAISLCHMKAHRREEVHGHTTVDLETNLGDIEYEITFHTASKPGLAKDFVRMVGQQAQVGEAEEIQKVRVDLVGNEFCCCFVACFSHTHKFLLCRGWVIPVHLPSASLSLMLKTSRKTK